MYNAIIPEMRDVKRILGERERSSHKGNFGYVGLVGGCARYSGAVKLASFFMKAVVFGMGLGFCGYANVTFNTNSGNNGVFGSMFTFEET